MLLRKITALLLLQSVLGVCFAQDVIVFMGAPGSGKGTQAELLSTKLQIPHISVGDTLRAAIKSDPALEHEISKYLSAGQMVPDHIVDPIILERIRQDDCKQGIILDGAIRSMSDISQTDAFLQQIGAKVSHVIYLEVEDRVLIERLSGRRVCESCGQNYHIVYAPAKNITKCDYCSANLIQREDDIPAVILQRVKIFRKESQPILQYYQKMDLLIVVDGSAGTPAEISQSITMQLEWHRSTPL